MEAADAQSEGNAAGSTRLISTPLPKNQRVCQIISEFLPGNFMQCPTGGFSQQMNSRTVNKSLLV